MEIAKPKLSLDGQIEHLKEKGVLFNIMNEAEAKEYLAQHNNYFKLTAYRKNYAVCRKSPAKAGLFRMYKI